MAPETEADEININFYLADGMNIAVANQYLDELVRKVEAIVPEDQIRYLTTEVRNGRAEVELTLVDAARRTVSSYDLADKIRSQIEGTIPGGRSEERRVGKGCRGR